MVIIRDDLDPFKIAFKIQEGLSDRETALDVAVNYRTPLLNTGTSEKNPRSKRKGETG